MRNDDNRYLVIYHGRRAICPLCAGLAVANGDMSLWCNDCHTLLRCIGQGNADNELVFEEVGVA